MVITKATKRRVKDSDKAAESNPKLKAVPVRFPAELLARIDAAAKKRGLGRSSWVRYASSRVLDEDQM